MPNNLVFNNVANQLLTQIYGTDGNAVRAIKTDSSGRLEVVGTFTAVGTITAIATESITELNAQIDGATGAGTALTVETLRMKTYSFYIRNVGTNEFKVKLQIAPVNEEAYYTDDSEVEFTVGTGTQSTMLLVPRYYLKYTRIQYEEISGPINAQVWFNGRG